jgi:hypothetical protein
MVPIVTTIEGMLRRVTNNPLNRPHKQPTVSPTIQIANTPAPASAANPIAVELSAIIEATEISISRTIMTIANGNAIIAFSEKLNVASDSDQALRKYGDAKLFKMNTKTAVSSKNDSHVNNQFGTLLLSFKFPPKVLLFKSSIFVVLYF